MKEARKGPRKRKNKLADKADRPDLPTDSSAHGPEPPDHHTEPSAPPAEAPATLADCQRRAAIVHELMARYPGDNIKQLARRIGIAPHTLSLSYKAATGKVLQDVIIENCFQHAARLLTTGTTELAIRQIADLCGYTLKSSFTHAFKRRFGISPRQYRRSVGVSEVYPQITQKNTD